MDRRNFLQKMGPIGALVLTVPAIAGNTEPVRVSGHPPPYLREGDYIGITCPAGAIDQRDARYSEVMMERWGFKTRFGRTIGRRWQQFGGTDEERAADFQQMLDDPNLKAILFGRGGYGSMRIMDKLNWDAFKKNPKWLIGYSDITAFHCHVSRCFGIPTIHSRMAGGFGSQEDLSETSLKNTLYGKPIQYQWETTTFNRPGKTQGILVGGNLSLIYAMQASVSELDTDGKILFIEDVSEYKYTVDRMLMNLKRSGKLDNLKALLVGGFTSIKKEDIAYFTMSIEEIIYEKVMEFDYPVCFNFPGGHQQPNLALKLGMAYDLEVKVGMAQLTEVRNAFPNPPLPLIDSIVMPQSPSLNL
jgi:muramoyltetrapeptide carboxypeptidase